VMHHPVPVMSGVNLARLGFINHKANRAARSPMAGAKRLYSLYQVIE
jgi:hypothetical protein